MPRTEISRPAPLAALTEWCSKNHHLNLGRWFQLLSAKLRGYYNYYGVFGNSKSLQEYYHEVVRIIFKWLNRRSQRRSKNWTGFKELLKHFQLPKPRIVERLFARKAAGSV